MTILVGLGNPGSKYSATKHNFGFWVLDRFAKKNALTFQSGKGDYLYAKSGNLICFFTSLEKRIECFLASNRSVKPINDPQCNRIIQNTSRRIPQAIRNLETKPLTNFYSTRNRRWQPWKIIVFFKVPIGATIQKLFISGWYCGNAQMNPPDHFFGFFRC